ncbi:transcriptional regulator [Subtercola boreus]|uniref:Transcriptional regulator n=1 Tax=Subtercola boreus TaxID=120213 RepID=A0A3E0W382_9MICO|nr:winged helix-turn-helix domain-containing protein [Subtercola boreus]RFA16834.1 transcriptional regulator [Subtercola boreus]
MSIAHLTSPRTTSYVAPAETPAIHSAPLSTAAPAPHIRAVPAGTEARGFVVYVGLDEEKAEADGTSLGSIVSQIRALVAQLAPSSETYAAVALAPRGSGGRDVEVVRLALQDPSALAKHRQNTEPGADPSDRARDGVVVDLSRKRVLLDNEAANLTYKEFELLQYLVLREGRTIERAELISSLWGAGHEDLDDIPNERTIDVHVRRLRAKLGDYEDIVRTVRGVGYRFDRHADVSVRQSSTPSPDLI